MDIQRLSEYRVMWLWVFFDLPTDTKSEVKAANLFRKNLLKDGFMMFQFSVYLRHCASRENLEVHIKRVKNFIPNRGTVSMLSVTDKQFEKMEVFEGVSVKSKPTERSQLE